MHKVHVKTKTLKGPWQHAIEPKYITLTHTQHTTYVHCMHVCIVLGRASYDFIANSHTHYNLCVVLV